jgi:hypothetical protein
VAMLAKLVSLLASPLIAHHIESMLLSEPRLSCSRNSEIPRKWRSYRGQVVPGRALNSSEAANSPIVQMGSFALSQS